MNPFDDCLDSSSKPRLDAPFDPFAIASVAPVSKAGPAVNPFAEPPPPPAKSSPKAVFSPKVQAAARRSSMARMAKQAETFDPFASATTTSTLPAPSPVTSPAPAGFDDPFFSQTSAASADPFAANPSFTDADPFAGPTTITSSFRLSEDATVDDDDTQSDQSEEWVDESAVNAHRFEDVSVTLERSEEGLGLVLDHKGEPPNHEVWIDELLPGGVADSSGKVNVGDKLITIDGHVVATTSMTECVMRMGQPKVRLTLRMVQGAEKAFLQMRKESVNKKTFDARKLSAEAGQLMPMEVPKYAGNRKVSGLYPAPTAEVNQIAAALAPSLKSKGGARRSSIVLDPKRRPSAGPSDARSINYNEIRVKLNRDETGLGLVLEHKGSPPHQQIWVDSIILGTPADTCGKIRVGDVVAEINGHEMGTTNMAEAGKMLTAPTVYLTFLRKQGAEDDPEVAAVSIDQMDLSEQLWCGPCLARFPGKTTRRLSSEWESMNFSTSGSAFCLYEQRYGAEPRLAVTLTHAHFITEPNNQQYLQMGSMDVFSIGKHGIFGDQKLVKLGSKEPGVVPRLVERLEKVINEEKSAYLKQTGRASSGSTRKSSAHRV